MGYYYQMIFYGSGDELALFEDAMQAAEMAWWMIELPSGAVFFNVNKIKMLGYKEKDADQFVHYKSFTDLIHPDDYEKAMKAMKDHLEGRAECYITKYRIKGVDGEYRTFLDKGKIVATNNKKEVSVAGIVIDITDAQSL